MSSTSGVTSSKPSPITPERGFVNHDSQKPKPVKDGNLPDGKYAQDADSGYRDETYNLPNSPRRERHGSAGSSREPKPVEHPVETERQISGHSPPQMMKRRDYMEVDPSAYEGIPAHHRPNPQLLSGGSHRMSPYSSTYNEILDNNIITPRKIRDDIPDSDLIDYEDDGEGESLLDDIEMEFDESQVRIFIALFHYDPCTMSPNPDAVDEELPFKEGQLIKVRLWTSYELMMAW